MWKTFCDFGVVIFGKICIPLPARTLSLPPSIGLPHVLFDLDFRKNYEPDLVRRFGPPIVSIANLSPNLRVDVQIGTSNSMKAEGVATILDWILGRDGATQVKGLVGGYHSHISMPVASIAGSIGVPQVSWGATSPLLSNKVNYPFFSRTIPPDSIQGGGMWEFVQHFKVPICTFVYADEPYGAGLFQTVINLASDAGVSFRVQPVSLPYMPVTYVSEVF